MGAAMNNSWGYSYWNCNWHGGAVVYRTTSTTEITHGTVATMDPALPLMALTAPRGLDCL